MEETLKPSTAWSASSRRRRTPASLCYRVLQFADGTRLMALPAALAEDAVTALAESLPIDD